MIRLVDISTESFYAQSSDIEMSNGCLMVDVPMKGQGIIVLIVNKKLILG